FSTFSVGLLGSTYYLGYVAGCVFGSQLVSKVGHIRVFTAMAAIASATPLTHGLLLIPVPWWLFRVVTGFCFAILFMVIESWLNERSTRENRGSVLGVYLVINLTVMTLGQMLLTLFDPNKFVLFAITSMLISLAAVPVALSSSQAPAPIERVKINLRRVFFVSPVGFFGCFIVGATNGAFWSLTPSFASANALGVSGIAILMSVTVLAGAAGQLPIGKMSDRVDRRKIILITSVIAACVGIFLWWRGESTDYALFILAAAWGFFAFPMYGLSIAHANDHAAADQFVEVSATLLLVFAVGAVVGPILAASLMTQFHASYLFAFTAVLHFLLALFVVWRMKLKSAPPMEEHVRYIDALEASQTVSSTFDAEVQKELVNAVKDEAEKGKESE
ncbi:MAG: MFS transporter, partial [Gammaproteobacteria bacterium]|nr:MFS transporter [Gammaproteobacteria bacterium]